MEDLGLLQSLQASPPPSACHMSPGLCQCPCEPGGHREGLFSESERFLKSWPVPHKHPCPAPTLGAHGADPSTRAGLGRRALPVTGPSDVPVSPIGREQLRCCAACRQLRGCAQGLGKGVPGPLSEGDGQGHRLLPRISTVPLALHRREAMGTDALSGRWRAWDRGPGFRLRVLVPSPHGADRGGKTTRTSGSFIAPSHDASLRAEPSRGTEPANTTPTSCKRKRQVPSWGTGRGDSTAGGRG